MNQYTIGQRALQAWKPVAKHAVPLLGLALIGVLFVSYLSPMSELVQRWSNDSEYHYAFLVPLFSGYLLWIRRDMIRGAALGGSWWGVPLLLAAAAMRWASAYFYFALLDPFSLIPCLAGLALLAGGRRALEWSWPAIGFLVFMIPLPGFLSGLLSHPLQRVGTIASTYAIQTLGIPAISLGNVIHLREGQIGVVEACSGLRMMMLFVTICAGAAFLMRRSVAEKIVIVLSAAPIALIANISRITATGVLHETVSHASADALLHDAAAVFMMPLAMALLWVEMAILARIFIDPGAGPLAVGVQQEEAVATRKQRARQRVRVPVFHNDPDPRRKVS